MSSKQITRALALLLSLLLCPPLLLAEEEGERWYEVEILLFTQNNSVYRDSEVWPLDYTLPSIAKSVELSASGSERGAARPTPFSRIPEGKLRLRQEAERFSRAKDVDLVLHLGWYQPGLPEEKAKAVHIVSDAMVTASNGAGVQPKIEGTLRLILSRYLHLESDMVLREALPEKSLDLPDYRAGTPQSNEDDTVATIPRSNSQSYQVYHMEESRRMRSGEIHYLDHPLFGIVALVSPYEPR